MPRGAVIAISHGGGPMPVLNDPSHKDIIYSLRNRAPKVLRLGTPEAPRAIVVVTAHWSEEKPTVSSGETHALFYDYGGFPREAYQLRYDAPGSPDVAEEVNQAFKEEGLKPLLDGKRGWDHGVFIPLLLIHPSATTPIIQVSVLSSEDPAQHLKMGRALSRLRESNIAIVGSGFASFHNLSTMRRLSSAPEDTKNAFYSRSREWNAALTEAVSEASFSKREDRLKQWRELPHAYEMHPPGGGDHFMPLLVCAGTADDGEKIGMYKDEFYGVDIFTYYWGGGEVE